MLAFCDDVVGPSDSSLDVQICGISRTSSENLERRSVADFNPTVVTQNLYSICNAGAPEHIKTIQHHLPFRSESYSLSFVSSGELQTKGTYATLTSLTAKVLKFHVLDAMHCI